MSANSHNTGDYSVIPHGIRILISLRRIRNMLLKVTAPTRRAGEDKFPYSIRLLPFHRVSCHFT